MLNAEIRLEDFSFNAGRNWGNDGEMYFCEVLLFGSVLGFEVTYLNIMDVELKLEFFR